MRHSIDLPRKLKLNTFPWHLLQLVSTGSHRQQRFLWDACRKACCRDRHQLDVCRGWTGNGGEAYGIPGEQVYIITMVDLKYILLTYFHGKEFSMTESYFAIWVESNLQGLDICLMGTWVAHVTSVTIKISRRLRDVVDITHIKTS